MKSNLTTITFPACVFGVISKKYCKAEALKLYLQAVHTLKCNLPLWVPGVLTSY